MFKIKEPLKLFTDTLIQDYAQYVANIIQREVEITVGEQQNIDKVCCSDICHCVRCRKTFTIHILVTNLTGLDVASEKERNRLRAILAAPFDATWFAHRIVGDKLLGVSYKYPPVETIRTYIDDHWAVIWDFDL